jgi:hypothetical protein
MSDFKVSVVENTNILFVESSIFNSIDIYNEESNIQTISSNNQSTILEIEKSDIDSLHIVTNYIGNIIFPADIVGLDDYLSNFIDNYEIDCGFP